VTGPPEPAGGDATLEPPEPPPEPPAPSPFASLSTRPSRLVPEAFELLAGSTRDLRQASFYIGWLVTGALAPFAILVWRVSQDFEALLPIGRQDLLAGGLDAVITASVLIVLIGLFVAFIESRAVAAVLLAARLEGRPIDLRSAIERSRRVFWRLVRATLLTTVPLFLVQLLSQRLTAEVLGGESEVSVISAGIMTAILLAPFVYVVTAIVLGDLSAIRAIRTSIGLFNAARRAALVIALFGWSAQLLTSFGIAAGLDLVLRAVDVIGGLAAPDALLNTLRALVLVGLVFAIGTLLFTVTAISLAPQVRMFLALTQLAPGLDAARTAPTGDQRRFRWLTLPYVALVVAALLTLSSGLRQLG
jgi:hypothetical protein